MICAELKATFGQPYKPVKDWLPHDCSALDIAEI